MDTLFKFTADEISFELEGSEKYVLSTLEEFLPYVRAAGGAAEEIAPRTGAAGRESALASWYRDVLPDGESPTMQDHILIFGYYLNRVVKQFIFVPDDMKAAFREIGHDALHLELSRDHYEGVFGRPIDDQILTDVAWLSSSAQITKAMALMEKFDSSYLFVVDDGRYRGVVTRLGLARILLEEQG